MSILDDYLKQKQLDDEKMNSYDDRVFQTQEEKEYFKKEIEEQKNSELDPKNIYDKFHQTYVKKSEKELIEEGLTENENVRVVVRRVHCPQCGKELISSAPIMFNPFTMEKIAKHDCTCGYKCNLEYAYPRVVFVNDENKEINAFSV